MNKKLLKIINTVLLNSNKEKITQIYDELRLYDDLGFDSLMLAELTVRIENETGIDVFEDGLVRTIGEIEAKIDKNG